MSDTSTPSDHALLLAWREGNEEAGSQLVRRHFAAVTRFFESRVDRDAMEELLQSTFLACVESRERVPEGVAFKAYLLGIARNKLLMHLRSKRGGARVSALLEEPGAGSHMAPSRFAAAREEERLLLKALRRLDMDLQIALELFYWEDLNTAEIAQVLEIPRGTVKTRLARARAQLQEHIRELSSTPELATSTIDGFERWARSLARAREDT
jgi:RNA polymerase sigma factor (sigma-70 family)